MSASPSNESTMKEPSSTTSATLKKFTLFPRLPTELRQKIWHHALPRPNVWEIEWSGQHQTWQFSVESKPSIPALYCVNMEARGEFLRSYTAVSLVSRAGSRIGQPPVSVSSFRCFFDLRYDTLYIAASSTAIYTYGNKLITQLHPDFLKKVKLLAIQGEEVYSGEFNIGTPYNISTPDTEVLAAKLARLLARTPEVTSLSVVVGGDYTQAPHVYGVPSNKPYGLVELAELTCGRPPTRHWVEAKKQLHAWVKFLLDHYPGAYQGDMSVKQVLRGGQLFIIDVWGLLDHESSST